MHFFKSQDSATPSDYDAIEVQDVARRQLPPLKSIHHLCLPVEWRSLGILAAGREELDIHPQHAVRALQEPACA